jgi:hypothetical protein
MAKSGGLSEALPAWAAWLPWDYERLWVVEAQRDAVLDAVWRWAPTRPVILTVPDTLETVPKAWPLAAVEIRRQAAESLVSQTRAHDLIWWPAGTLSEERRWAPTYEALFAKGCYVLHWVHPEPAIVRLYEAYIVRAVAGVDDWFVLGWDPDAV